MKPMLLIPTRKKGMVTFLSFLTAVNLHTPDKVAGFCKKELVFGALARVFSADRNVCATLDL